MKSYKLNKTLENSTYPIEQELKKVNKSAQGSAWKTVATLSTVVFSGIATNFIYENGLLTCQINTLIKKHNWNISLSQFFLCTLIAIYAICIIINLIVYIYNMLKELPQNMKKNSYGRKKLSEKFHKSIINDMVVGLSFLDKTDEEADTEIKKMYLFEATYYFMQAEKQISQMGIFDDKKKTYNNKLIEEIGYETLLTMLTVFKNGVEKIIEKMPNSEKDITECKELDRIYGNLKIHINLLKSKQYKKLWYKRNQS